MQRRSLIRGAGAGLAASLAGPGLLRAQAATTLRFTPQQDVVTLRIAENVKIQVALSGIAGQAKDAATVELAKSE